MAVNFNSNSKPKQTNLSGGSPASSKSRGDSTSNRSAYNSRSASSKGFKEFRKIEKQRAKAREQQYHPNSSSTRKKLAVLGVAVFLISAGVLTGYFLPFFGPKESMKQTAAVFRSEAEQTADSNAQDSQTLPDTEIRPSAGSEDDNVPEIWESVTSNNETAGFSDAQKDAVNKASPAKGTEIGSGEGNESQYQQQNTNQASQEKNTQSNLEHSSNQSNSGQSSSSNVDLNSADSTPNQTSPEISLNSGTENSASEKEKSLADSQTEQQNIQNDPNEPGTPSSNDQDYSVYSDLSDLYSDELAEKTPSEEDSETYIYAYTMDDVQNIAFTQYLISLLENEDVDLMLNLLNQFLPNNPDLEELFAYLIINTTYYEMDSEQDTLIQYMLDNYMEDMLNRIIETYFE